MLNRMSRGVSAGLLALALCAHAEGEPASPAPGSRTPITNVTFVALDTETTGFDPVKDRVVEIGAVKFKGGEIIGQQSWLVNPGMAIPYWAGRVHGISDEMVAREPGFREVYPEFEAFIAGSVLLAHNARFDLAFIREEAKRNGLKAPVNDVIDSLPLFRKWFPDSEKHSLEGLSEHLKIGDEGFHRALADSMQLYRILELGLEQQKKVTTLGTLEKSAGGPLHF
jgi:DNA polymerase III epsilon subunit family exonuclease